MKRRECILGLLILAVLPARGAAASAVGGPQESPEFVLARFGIVGHSRLGHWTPVQLTLRGGAVAVSGRVSVTVLDDEGLPVRYWAGELVRLEPGRETPVRLCVRFGRAASTMVAEYCADGRVLACREFTSADKTPPTVFLPPADANQDVVLVLGGEAAYVEQSVRLGETSAAPRTIVVRCPDLADLPVDAIGYEAVDTVVFSAGRADGRQDLAASGPQLAAIERWVQSGGRLILCIGEGAESLLGPGGSLERFSPGRSVGSVVLRQTDAIEVFSGSPIPIVVENEWRVPKLAGVQGAIEAGDRDLPLIVRKAMGFGQVVLLTADPNEEPLVRWKGRPSLMAKLLDRPVSPRSDPIAARGMMHLGFGDVAGQLRKALDRFEGVTLVSFWAVVLGISLLALLIGPVDYFLLRRFAPSLVWTWVTFPTVAVAACLAAYFAAHRTKGADSHAAHAEIVDVDVDSGLVRGTAWTSVFSPKSRPYDLSFEPSVFDGSQPAAVDSRLAWFGLSGSGLGGMTPSVLALATPGNSYDLRGDRIEGLPIPIWSTRSLTARWSGRVRSPICADLTDQNDLLEGTITAALPCPLEDCFLVYGRWVHELGSIEPGATVRMGAAVRRGELKTFLTGQKTELSENKGSYRLVSTPYDRSNVDLRTILRTMMFFEASGATTYTGLLGRYQGFVDCSSFVRTGRAVLVGYAPSDPVNARRCGSRLVGAPAGQPVRGMASPGDPRAVAFRWILPVRKT